jgi:hypothetical protein
VRCFKGPGACSCGPARRRPDQGIPLNGTSTTGLTFVGASPRHSVTRNTSHSMKCETKRYALQRQQFSGRDLEVAAADTIVVVRLG